MLISHTPWLLLLNHGVTRFLRMRVTAMKFSTVSMAIVLISLILTVYASEAEAQQPTEGFFSLVIGHSFLKPCYEKAA